MKRAGATSKQKTGKRSGGLEKLKEAIAAGTKRDYPRAVQLLEEMLANGEGPSEALLYLGRSYHALGDYSRALAAFRDYLAEKPASAQAQFFAGRSYLSLGQSGRAIPLLKKALSRRPNDVMTMAVLGMAYLKHKKSGRAVDLLQKAVEAAPNNKKIYRGYVHALLVRGLRLAHAGEDELAIQMLGFVIENGLDAPLPRLELGRLCREAGELNAALEHYIKAAEFSPNDPKIRWYIASLYMALGDDEDAIHELENIKALSGELPDVQWNQELIDRFLIRSLIEAADWRGAAEACRSSLKNDEGDPAVHALLAESLRNLKDLENAALHAIRAIELSPEEAGLHYALILILFEKEDWKALEGEIEAAENCGIDDATLLHFRALLASRIEGHDKEVISLLQDAIRSSGPAPELLYSLADRYRRLGLLDLAETWYRKTRSLMVRHERAWLGELSCAEALSHKGDKAAKDRLEKCYTSYIALWDDNLSIRREWALYLVHQKRFKEAAEELEYLLGYEPSNPTLRKLLAYLYRKAKRYREASILLKGLLRDNPRDLSLLMELCFSLDRAGATSYAATLLTKALPLFPKSGEPAMALGLITLRSGKTEAAIDAFREAASRSPQDPKPCRHLAELYRKSGVQELSDRYEHEASLREGALAEASPAKVKRAPKRK